jgi:hypothetical protein
MKINGKAGVHVLTFYPDATETAVMATNRAGPDLGFADNPLRLLSMRSSPRSKTMMQK